MKRSKKTTFTGIKALFTAICLIIVSISTCVPAYADNGSDETGRVYYQLETDIGQYAYADYANNRYFTLVDDKIYVYDAESGIHNEFYNFKDKSADPATFMFYDFYTLDSKLYYLYQCGGSSYIMIVDFNKLSIYNNKLNIACTSLIALNSGDIITFSPVNKGIVFIIHSDGSTSSHNVPSGVNDFYGEDLIGNIYYSASNGLTFASYDGKSFVPSNKKVSGVNIDLNKHTSALEIYDRRILADYTGNVCSLSDGKADKLFAFNRPNFSDINYQGFGSETVFVPDSQYAIGMGGNASLDLYNYVENEYISSLDTKHNVYAVIRFGSGVLCFEKDSTGCYVEIIPISLFTQIQSSVTNLNELDVYKNRSSSDVAQKYIQAISGFDLSEDMLEESGSATAPYAQSVMSQRAQQALLNFSNYQRWICGLSDYQTGGKESVELAAKGAILLNASSVQGHYPPKPYDMDEDFYNIAYKGTGGNISYGHENTIKGGIQAIRALTNDTNNQSNAEIYSENGLNYQGYNTPGHRNSFLQRGGDYITYGSSDRVLLQYFEYAQLNPNHSGTFTENNNNEAAYAWPAPGAFPADEIDTEAFWTVYLNTDKINTGYKNLIITITDLQTGESVVRNTVMHDVDGQREGYSLSTFWGKSISFTPPKTDSYKGKSYKITIENLVDGKGMPAEIEYTINMFDYSDKFIIDGIEYEISENGELVPVHVPATEPVTSQPVTEPVTSQPVTEPVTIPEITEPSSVPTDPTIEPTTVPGETTPYLIGDVNSDGKVNGMDSSILKRFLAGWDNYESRIKNMKAADVNSDGKVNGLDSSILARHLAGWSQYVKYFD